MHQYGVREVEKLLRLPRSTIRASIDAGFVSPTRGPRNAWLFSFQDLIVLRTVQALADAKVPRQRITRSVKQLRRHLPDSMPLSGLSICAVADRVVVKEGASLWQAESGQYLLAFEGDPADGSLNIAGGTGPFHLENVGPSRTPRAPQSRGLDAEDWYDQGVTLESRDAEGAIEAYQRAIAADPRLVDAYINMGLLLHQARRHADAERVYRDAIGANGPDPVVLYNLGVLLEDMDRRSDALEAYRDALRGNPELADCHYNLALLYEGMKKPKDAIRHMAQYRRLVGK